MKYPFMSSSTEVYSDYHVFITQFALGEGIVCLSTLKYFLFDFRGKCCTIYMPSIFIFDCSFDIFGPSDILNFDSGAFNLLPLDRKIYIYTKLTILDLGL